MKAERDGEGDNEVKENILSRQTDLWCWRALGIWMKTAYALTTVTLGLM
jgi:hypothetical protein